MFASRRRWWHWRRTRTDLGLLAQRQRHGRAIGCGACYRRCVLALSRPDREVPAPAPAAVRPASRRMPG